MSERQANAYFNNDRNSGAQREYLDEGHYNIKWTAPRNGTFYLIGDIYQRSNTRIVHSELEIE